MELTRDALGFIILDDVKNISNTPFSASFKFKNKENSYIFRQIKSIKDIYNELIAEEIAIEFGIPCAHYDIASYYEQIGNISAIFILENEKYIPMSQILKSIYKNEKLDKYNNLEDIEVCLRYIYKKEEIVNKLMNELKNIFIYDVLIGNIDRHIDNYGLIENQDGIHFECVFDNEKMLSQLSIKSGIYSLGIDRSDYYPYEEDYYDHDNFLEKFVKINPSYKEIIEEKIQILKEENIDKILKRVEKRIQAPIKEWIKEEIKDKFEKNLSMIKQVLEDKKVYNKTR